MGWALGLEVGERVRVRFLDGVAVALVTADGIDVDTEENPVVVRRSLILGGAAALALGGVAALFGVPRWLRDRQMSAPKAEAFE